MKYGFITPPLLILFCIGIQNNSLAYELYVLVSLSGLVLLLRSKCGFKELPKETQNFLYLLLSFGIYVLLRVAINSPPVLTEFRFQTIIVMLLSPFFTIYCYYVIYQFENKNQIFWGMSAMAGLACFIFLIILLINYDGTRFFGGVVLRHEPIKVGNKGMLLGLILLPLLVSPIAIKFKLLSLIGILSGISISLLSQSRGGWIALVVAFLSIIFFLYRFGEGKKATILCSFFALLIIAIIVLMPYHYVDERIVLAYKQILDYFNGGNPNTSVGYRLQLWEKSIQSIAENFWLGLGWQNSWHLYIAQDGQSFKNPHNQFLHIWTELGTLGLISYLALFLYPIYLCYKRIIQQSSFANHIAPTALSILILIESIMEFNLWDNTSASKSFMILLILFTVVAFSICFDKQRHNRK